MGTIRAIFILVVLTVVTPPMMMLQGLLLALKSRAARKLPVAYHRFICFLLGVRVDWEGILSDKRPLLIAANHVSWLDISVFGSIAPLSFIAKSEVAGWPVFGWLAKLQRTVFVDRNRRAHTGRVNNVIAGRLADGDVMVLFAEGTSSDGNCVLPFRSALLGAAHDLADDDLEDDVTPAIYVQPVALVYTHLNGLPMGHQHRPVVAWHGDIELAPHIWRLLKSGSIDVTVAFGEPIPLARVTERKAVAMNAENAVRGMAAALLAGHSGKALKTAPLPAAVETG
jgi:1-acyl-sn-glycerol-3-phosphate acyltransferase